MKDLTAGWGFVGDHGEVGRQTSKIVIGVRAIGDGDGGRACGNDFVLTVNLQDEAVRGDVDESTDPGTVSAGF